MMLSKSSPEHSKSPHLVVIFRRYHGTDRRKGYDFDTVLVHQHHHALTKTNPYGTVSQTLQNSLPTAQPIPSCPTCVRGDQRHQTRTEAPLSRFHETTSWTRCFRLFMILFHSWVWSGSVGSNPILDRDRKSVV